MITLNSLYFNKNEIITKQLLSTDIREDSTYLFNTSKGSLIYNNSEEDKDNDEFILFYKRSNNFKDIDNFKRFSINSKSTIHLTKILEIENPVLTVDYLIQTDTNISFLIFTDKNLNDEILFRTYLNVINKTQESQILKKFKVVREIPFPEDWLID